MEKKGFYSINYFRKFVSVFGFLLIPFFILAVNILVHPVDDAAAHMGQASTTKPCTQCHSVATTTTGANIYVAINGTETSTITLSDNSTAQTFEVDYYFTATRGPSDESVGAQINLPDTTWSVSAGTSNSKTITADPTYGGWHSSWDSSGSASWQLQTNTNLDWIANYGATAWDFDTKTNDTICDMGPTVCDGGSGGTDQDGVAEKMGTDAIITVPAGYTPGTYSVILYGIGHDGGTKAYISTTISVTVEAPAGNNPPTLTVNQPDGTGDTIAENGSFTVNYDLSDDEETVTVALYYDTNNTGTDGVAIAGCGTEPEAAGGTCAWDTTGVAPGTYYIYGLTTDGVNPQVSDYSSGVVTINAAPTLTVSQPDGTGDTVIEGANYSITYDLADSDDVVTVAFYYDTDAVGLNGTLIGGCTAEPEGAGATCSWDTTGVTPGSYYVYGITNDGVNPQVSDYSPGQITINANQSPTLTVNQPDGVSDTIAENASFTINYNLADAEEIVTAAFYYDNDAAGLDGTLIGGCTAEPEGAGATCAWNTTGVAPGTYYVYGITNDGVNPQVSDYSSGVVTINDAPALTVNQPDGVSDTVTVGFPFTIDYDLTDTDDVVSVAFYYDTNNSGLDGTLVSGTCASTGEGTGATCTWDTTGVPLGSYFIYGLTTGDAVNPQQSAYSSGQVTVSANQSPTLTVNQPDGAGDTIAENTSFTINYDLADVEETVSVALYYDTNNSGLDGVAIAGCGTEPEATGGTCAWNTTGVAPGTYYIYGLTNDGVNPQVSAYSSGVVTIKDPPTLTVSQPDGVSDTVIEGTPFSITYTLADTDDVVTVAFYYDTDATGLNGTAIPGGCATAAEGTGATCSWDTTGMTPGSYYVYGLTTDGVNPQVSDYSPGQITINANQPPTLTVNQPAGANTIAENTSFTINYDLADTEETVTVAFYYDTNNSGLDGVAIGGCAAEPEGTGATCSWDTTGVTPGTYYIYGLTTDGVNPQVSDYSTGTVTINDAPALTVNQPDGVSDTVTVGFPFTIDYDLTDTDDVVTVAFYYDTNNSGLDGTLVSGTCASTGEGTGATCSWDTTGVPLGSYFIYGLTTGDAVNPQTSAYSSGQVTVSANQSPTLTVNQPDGTGDTIAENGSFTINYDLADVEETVTAAFFYDTNNSGLDGVAIVGCGTEPEAAGGTCAWNTTGVAPGTYYIYGLTNDGVNPQVSAYSSGVVTIKDPPTLTVSQPDGAGDTVIEGASYSITYDLADTDDVVTVAFYYDNDATGLNGTLIGGCTAEPEGAGATCSWDTTGMTPGTYYVYGLTTDGVNPQVSDYSPGQITINANQPPTLTVNQPAGANTIAENTLFTINYDLADTEEIVTVAFYYDTNNSGLDGTLVSGTCASAAEGTGATCSWDTTGVTPGTYYIYGLTTDGVNPQVSDYSSGTVTINDAPALTVNQPDGVGDTITEGTPFTIDYDLTDSDDVVTVAFYYDTNNSGTDGVAITGCGTEPEAAGGTCSWNTTGVPEGSYYVYGLTTGDAVNGQQSAYSSGQVTIGANTSPTLTVNQPAGASTVAENGSFTINYDLADAEDVVTAAFYYDTNNTGLDGVAITGACATAPEGTGATCSWNTTGVTPGTYYVYGLTSDGVNPQVSDYSTGTVTINDAPTLTVNQPDGTGDTVAVGHSFDINYNLADTDDNVTVAFYYDNDATGLNGTLIGGCTAEPEGSGAICSWDTTGMTPGNYFVYGITNDGVNAQVSDYSPGQITINANQSPTLTVNQPDGVSDTVAAGNPFSINYTLADTDDTVTVAFYYDTNSSGLDGSAITGACAAAAEGTGATCSWDTTGVTPGNYFVYGLTSDGINPLVSDYSSGQVTIDPPPDTDPPAFGGITSAVDAATDKEVTLGWSAATDPSTPITYNVYVSTTSGTQDFGAAPYDSVQSATAITVSNLTNGQIYYFVVRAEDNYGNEETNTTELSATPSDTVIPSFSGVSNAVDANTNGAVNLTWSAATDSSGPIDYNVYVATSSGGHNFISPYTTTQNSTGVTVTGLTNTVPYYFVVRAEDPYGNEELNTTEVSATPTDGTDPSFGGLLSATDNTNGGEVDLVWPTATDSSTPITYNVYLAISSGGQNFGAAPYVSTNETTGTTVTGLVNDQVYYFVVRAQDAAGNEDTNTTERFATPTVLSDTDPPIFGGLATATDRNTDGEVLLTWATATDINPITYNVYVSTTPGGQNFGSINRSTGDTWVIVDNLINGQDYYFVVRAEDSEGNEETNTTERSATPTESVPPTFLGVSTATDANTDGEVNLTWNPAADTSLPITYNVYVATSSGGQNFGAAPHSSTQNVTGMTVSGLANGTPYFFVVRAEDFYGNEDTNTAEVSATPTLSADSVAPTFGGLNSANDANTDGAVTLAWSAATDPSTPITYNIYWATSSGGQNFTTTNATTTNGSGTTVSGLSNGTWYYFVVRAKDNAGNEDNNTVEFSARPTVGSGDLSPPDDITDLTVSTDMSQIYSSYLLLSWTAPGDDGATGTATTYDIRYSESPIIDQASWDAATQAAGLPVPQPAGTTEYFYVNGLESNTSYYFAIKTEDEIPNPSSFSNSPYGKTGLLSSKWNMISSPFTPNPPQTYSSQFMDDNGGSGSMWAYSASAGWVDPGNIVPGKGIMIYSTKANTPTDVTGLTNTAAYYELALEDGWNFVANPYLNGVNLSDCLVEYGTGFQTYETAVTAAVVRNALHIWDGSTYTWETWDVAVLDPWKAYWIFVDNAGGVTLRINKP